MVPKIKMTDEAVVTLAKEVKQRGCLWNQEDKYHNDRYHVLTAWKEISKIVKLPEDVIRVKWKNLRDLFKREVRRGKVVSLEEYTGRWRHFELLWFLHRPEDYSNVENDDDSHHNDCADDDVTTNDEFNKTVDHFVKFEPPDANEVEVYLDDAVDPIPDKRRRYNDDDYDMMFLKSLTPYLRQLEPIRKLVVRSKIQDMLMNEIAAQTMTNKSINKKS